MFVLLPWLREVAPPPAERIEDLSLLQKQMEKWLSKSLEADVVWLEYKAASLHGHIEKEGEQKFIKIHKNGMASLELERSQKISHYFPAIVGEEVISIPPFECLIEPYVSSIEKPGGLLFDIYYLYPDQVIPIVSKTIKIVQRAVLNTLDIKVAPAVNDRFFFERLRTQEQDGISGALETFYSKKQLLNLPWNDLLKKKFLINGVSYQLTMQDLVENARAALNPAQKRPLAICHGDWTDMNICLVEGAPYFIDCEISGENDPIGDAIVFLVYCGLQGDYLGPKYYRHHFRYRDESIEKINLNRPPIEWTISFDTIQIEGGKSLDISPERKMAMQYFIDHYFNPLVKEIRNRGVSEQEIEKKIRAALFARLLPVYDLTLFEQEDQARILAVLIQTLSQNNEPAISAFLRYL